MKVELKSIQGPWDTGWVLDKHSIASVCTGYNEQGHPVFDTTRTEVGEATFQLKYRRDWEQISPLAEAILHHVCPKLDDVGFIVPMPASTLRKRQPVTEIAMKVGKLLGVPVFDTLLLKAENGKSLKNLQSKDEKIEALRDTFTVSDTISNDGKWNVLVIDDLFHTGASMEAACKVLRAYPKVRKIYVAALTWR